MMVRTQISLDSELHTRVRARAVELGISLAEYMRRLVSQDLSRPPDTADRSIIFDLGPSSDTDVASEKARMIGKATATGKLRRARPQ